MSFLMPLLALALLASPPGVLQSGSGVIEGIVSQAGTGTPIPGTGITLSGNGTLRQTTTDNSGRFVIAGVSQGRYTLSAHRDGYLGTAADGTLQMSPSRPVSVEEGQPATPLMLTLALGGVISGRLLDPAGRPLANRMLEVLTQNSRDRRIANTNDRGEFRFAGLVPGQYVVAAASRLGGPNASVRDTYARTYYPGTIESSRAVPITVALGSDVSGVDFIIQTSVVVSVSGKVILDLPDVRFPYTLPGLVPQLLLHSFDPDPMNTQGTRDTGRAVDISDGHFEIHGVQPGRYEIVVVVPGSGTAYIGRTRIDTNYQDVKDVTIMVRPGVNVPVQVNANAGSNVAAVQSVELRVKDSQRPIGISSALGGSESFLIQHVPAGEYEIHVTTTPGTRVADIQQSGRSVLNEGIIVEDQPPQPIHLILERALP